MGSGIPAYRSDCGRVTGGVPAAAPTGYPRCDSAGSGLDAEAASQLSQLSQQGLVFNVLHEDGDLSGLAAYVDDSGEGRWTVQESVELAVPIPVITAALQARFRSRQDQPFGAKLLSAMRNQFGGHTVKRAD